MATTFTATVSYEGDVKQYILQPLADSGRDYFSEFTLIPNVTGKSQVPHIATVTKTAVAGTNCGWNPTGTVTLTDKEWDTNPIQHQVQLCKQDLKDTYALSGLAMNSDMDFTDTEIANLIWDQFQRGIIQDFKSIVMLGDSAGAAGLEDYLETTNGVVQELIASGTAAHNFVAADVTGVAVGALLVDDCLQILQHLYDNCDDVLKATPDNEKRFYVTGGLYQNLKASMTGFDTGLTTLNTTPSIVMDGFQAVSYNGVEVVPLWELSEPISTNTASFAGAAANMTQLAIYTVPSNIAIGTDATQINAEMLYNPYEKWVQLEARYDLVASYLHDELIAAYFHASA